MKTTTYKVEIFIAGGEYDVRSACARYCNNVGLCVTMTKTNYIYTSGSAEGWIIGLINYAKYPKKKAEVWDSAWWLTKTLLYFTGQEDCTIQDHEKSVLVTLKDFDQ